jgi:hypothetical protein
MAAGLRAWMPANWSSLIVGLRLEAAMASRNAA